MEQGLHVLLVEDREGLQYLYRTILEDFGMTVDAAEDYASAKAYVEGHAEYDAAIIDTEIPGPRPDAGLLIGDMFKAKHTTAFLAGMSGNSLKEKEWLEITPHFYLKDLNNDFISFVQKHLTSGHEYQ